MVRHLTLDCWWRSNGPFS